VQLLGNVGLHVPNDAIARAAGAAIPKPLNLL
jgi:hypothetical protein